MKKFVSLSLLVFLFINVNAQQRIAKGNVFDESSRQGLDSALVTVYDTNIFVYTFKSGAFNINIPKGRRYLEISHRDYKTKWIILGQGFQHRITKVYLLSTQSVDRAMNDKMMQESTFLRYRNTLSLSLIELFAVAIAVRYERFIGKNHSVGAHCSFYINGRDPVNMGSEHDYYHEYQGFKLAPAYRFYPYRKKSKGLFLEAKIPFGYIHFSKLDYHSTAYTHLDVYKEYSTWTYGPSICLGVSFYLPKTKHGIITISFGYQNFPIDVPEEASRTINSNVTLSFPTNIDFWYMPGPGSNFEMKFLIGGIF